ncbi:putative cyclin-dependent kinase inhibitor [Helianthus anomalus]
MSDPVAVMEVAQPLDNNNNNSNNSSGSAKRRKVGNGELRLSSSKPVRITGFESFDSDDVINTSKKLSDTVEKEELTSEGDIPASCCSVNADLEKTAEATSVRCNLARRESFPVQQVIKTHSLSMAEKPPVLTNSRRRVPPEKTPPAAELEEFFAAAEKKLQNRFKDKYNYDVVNDVPLKGRFEWIQLKP